MRSVRNHLGLKVPKGADLHKKILIWSSGDNRETYKQGRGKEEAQKKRRTENLITFSKAYLQGVLYPRDDFVVVTLNVVDYNVYHILIDNESSASILFYDAFIKIGFFFELS